LVNKAGDMRQGLLNLKQQAVWPEKVETVPAVKTPVEKTQPLPEVLPLNLASATEDLSDKSPEKGVDARELFGDKLVVVKDGIVPTVPWLKTLESTAEKVAFSLGAPLLSVPAESKKSLSDMKGTPVVAMRSEKSAPSFVFEKAVPALGEKPVPEFGAVRVEPTAALYGEAGTAADGEMKGQPPHGKSVAPLSLKGRDESPEAAGAKDAPQTASREALAVGEPFKDGFVQKLHFKEQEFDVKDTQEMVSRLVEQAKLTQRPGVSEMTIRLRPESLGEMTVRIIAESGGAISASFHSNNSEVRGILQEALPAIRQELSNSGLKVHDVGVYAGLGDFQSFTQNQPGSQAESKVNKIGRGRLQPEEQGQDEGPSAPSGENRSSAGGVDYRV
jgi:hypothetical protein